MIDVPLSTFGRTYGELFHMPKQRRWAMKAEPQVATRLKRMFDGVKKEASGAVLVSDSPANCRDLVWFLERYPLEMSEADRAKLVANADDHREKTEAVYRLLSGDCLPTDFELALPPRQYQKIPASIVLRTGSLLLADELGLGKTVSAICCFTDKRTIPALVVTLTSLPIQWAEMIQRFAPNLRTHIIRSTKPYDLRLHRPKKGARLVEGPFPDVIITSYSKLAGWGDTLSGMCRMVVFDEIQELHLSDSDKYVGAKQIANGADYRLGLSGTPVINYGGEIYNVLDVVQPYCLGDREEFSRDWCKSDGRKLSVKEPRVLGHFLREQGVMLRRTREEVGRELPALTRVIHHVESDMAALEKVETVAAELARTILTQQGVKGWDKLKASEELTYLLRQATGLAKAPYVAEFVRMLLEQDEKRTVLLFGWHRLVYDVWADLLADFNPAWYTGSESTTQKEESKRRFLSGETRLMFMSLRAGAGLDGIQYVCQDVVVGELDWSPKVHDQNIGRVHRDGQTKPVFAYYLVTDCGSDPVVSDVLGLKRSQSDGIIDPDAEILESLTPDDDHVAQLARGYLEQRGIRVPKTESA